MSKLTLKSDENLLMLDKLIKKWGDETTKISKMLEHGINLCFSILFVKNKKYDNNVLLNNMINLLLTYTD